MKNKGTRLLGLFTFILLAIATMSVTYAYPVMDGSPLNDDEIAEVIAQNLKDKSCSFEIYLDRWIGGGRGTSEMMAYFWKAQALDPINCSDWSTFDVQTSGQKNDKGAYTYILSPVYLYGDRTDEMRKATSDQADKIIKYYIKDDMTDAEKEYILYKYISSTISYDNDTYQKNIAAMTSLAHSAYGALVQDSAVCNAYAKAFTMLLWKCGIKSEIVSNWDHAWNIVYLDGDGYYCDPTWESEETSRNGFFEPHYLNLTSNQMSTSRQIDIVNYPKCKATKYSVDNITDWVRYDILITKITHVGKLDTFEDTDERKDPYNNTAVKIDQSEADGKPVDLSDRVREPGKVSYSTLMTVGLLALTELVLFIVAVLKNKADMIRISNNLNQVAVENGGPIRASAIELSEFIRDHGKDIREKAKEEKPDIGRYQLEIRQLKESNRDLEDEVKWQKEEIDRLNYLKNNMGKSKPSELETKMIEAQRQVHSAQAEIEAIKIDNQRLRNKLTDIKDENRRLNDLVNELKKKLEEVDRR